MNAYRLALIVRVFAGTLSLVPHTQKSFFPQKHYKILTLAKCLLQNKQVFLGRVKMGHLVRNSIFVMFEFMGYIRAVKFF